MYWRRTVNQINVGKMLTAYFDLREDDIQSLKLNSKVRIDNSWWTINKVIDYDCNAQNLTKVELMSADTEIDLAPFKKGSVTPTTIGDLASHTGEHTLQQLVCGERNTRNVSECNLRAG